MATCSHDVRVLYCRPMSAHDENESSHFLQWLAPDERQRADRFQSDSSRRNFLTSRLVLRAWLAQHAGVSPLELRFTTTSYGQPVLAEPTKTRHIRFNLSHTTGLIMLAFSSNFDVGVDTELVRTPPLKLAERLFAPSELIAIRQAQGTRLAQTFFKYWTLKEAYLKARGIGLSIPLDSFSIDINEHEGIGLSIDSRFDSGRGGWAFRSLEPTSTHTAAVCVANSGQPIRISSDWVRPCEILARGAVNSSGLHTLRPGNAHKRLQS